VILQSGLVTVWGVKASEHVLVVLEESVVTLVIFSSIIHFIDRIAIILLVVSVLMTVLRHFSSQITLQSESHGVIFSEDLRLGLGQASLSVVSSILNILPEVFLGQVLRGQVQLLLIRRKNTS
jgi:hypothetical protein